MALKGLTDNEVKKIQETYGKNELTKSKKDNTFIKIIKIICEPMFLLLIISALIYFLLGEVQDGLIMLISISGIIIIEIVQELKTDKTLESLKELSTSKIMVIRNGVKAEILTTDLVPGDLMFLYEGIKIPADGKLLKCSGLSVDESTLTGEVLGVFKTLTDASDNYFKNNYCYAGTLVLQGSGLAIVTEIGNNTEYGKIGKSLESVEEEKTPLQEQIKTLIKYSVLLAFSLFTLIFIITFINLSNLTLNDRFVQSLLSAITIAIAMIPEEFPVILTVFLSMGAWRLAKKKSIVKKLPSVETLGSISTLCVDKTGTITQNKMIVKEIWSSNNDELDLISNMAFACNEVIYDPMEKAMISFAKEKQITKAFINSFAKIKEFPFTNELKIMGVVRKSKKDYSLSVKGSIERVLSYCDLKSSTKKVIINKANEMASGGLRVIGVAKRLYKHQKDLPNDYNDFNLEFLGLVGLYDPPKEHIIKDIEECYKAGINVIMITGDNGITASAIAKQIGMKNFENVITGNDIELMNDRELQKAVKKTNIFSRVIPEHKLRIVKALKANGEIVGMTGDGVNDAPALKSADIGIAMGDKGSGVSREAADLILLDDNFKTITETIKDGRRIYDNIKKAVGYIFTIHVPIALASLLAPILKIAPANLLLLPVHIVLLELIIDPTCSIILERIPAESNIMNRKPRKKNESIINFKEMLFSIFQGLLLFIASFSTYYFYYKNGDVLTGRTMGILIIMIGNIFLVEVCSSKHDLAVTNFKSLIKDKVFLIINGLMIFILFILINTPLRSIFKFTELSFSEVMLAILLAFVSTFIFECQKLPKISH